MTVQYRQCLLELMAYRMETGAVRVDYGTIHSLGSLVVWFSQADTGGHDETRWQAP